MGIYKMSNIFLNGTLQDILDTVSENTIDLPKWITVVDKNNIVDSITSNSENESLFLKQNNITGGNSEFSVTSSAVVGDENNVYSNTSVEEVNHGDEFSATSANIVGGNDDKEFSATSVEEANHGDDLVGGAANQDENQNSNDINQLIAMLTTETDTESEFESSNFKIQLGGGEHEDFDTVTSLTSTEQLENQLKTMFNLRGGAKKKKSKKKSKKKKSKKTSKKKKSKKTSKKKKSKG